MKIILSLILLFLLNIFTVTKPEVDSSHSIIYSNPLFLRAVSLNGEHLLADKFWLLSKYIDETKMGDEVNSEEFFQVYKSIAILDSSLEVAIIYASTYLASIQERDDLAIKLLQIGQMLNPDSFQYIFTELIMNIVYIENRDLEYLQKLAKKISRLPDRKKYIGRIDVTKWADDIISYLQQKSIKQKIREEDQKWLKSIER